MAKKTFVPSHEKIASLLAKHGVLKQGPVDVLEAIQHNTQSAEANELFGNNMDQYGVTVEASHGPTNLRGRPFGDPKGSTLQKDNFDYLVVGAKEKDEQRHDILQQIQQKNKQAHERQVRKMRLRSANLNRAARRFQSLPRRKAQRGEHTPSHTPTPTLKMK